MSYTWRAAFVLMMATALAVVVLWSLRPTLAWAHFCEDNYTIQQEREACWWRYWNGLSTPEDMAGTVQSMVDDTPQPTPTPYPTSTPLAQFRPWDGAVCNTYYTIQRAREDCWWRWHNGLPAPQDLAGAVQPRVTATPQPTATVAVQPTVTATLQPTATATVQPTVDATPQPTPTPYPTSTPLAQFRPWDGTVCNTYYTIQRAREDCWWRWHNGLSAPADIAATPRPMVTATPRPTVTATPQPTVTATPQPTVAATPQPTVIATPRSTATPYPTPTPLAQFRSWDGTLCDTYYTSQRDREDCWWRWHNGLPLNP